MRLKGIIKRALCRIEAKKYKSMK